jgi:uncharacterized protein YeaO (DUF488 family)
MKIITRRIYDDPAGKGGYRVLVDRLWPRGLRKDQVYVDLWLREIAPSDSLRKWFGHEPPRWEGFKRRYFHELGKKHDLVDHLLAAAGGTMIILLYGAKDTEHNQAAALKEYLETVIAAV